MNARNSTAWKISIFEDELKDNDNIVKRAGYFNITVTSTWIPVTPAGDFPTPSEYLIYIFVSMKNNATFM